MRGAATTGVRAQRVELHDGALGRRIALTFLLLGAVYAALLTTLVAVGVSGALVAVIAAVAIGVQLAGGDRLAMRAIGAKEVTPAERPELHAAVDRICIQADMPKPRIAVAAGAMPNAMAVGRTGGTATVCVTTRMLSLLDPPELEAVLAHELAHIKHHDVLVMTIASFFSLVAAFVVRIGNVLGHAALKAVAIGVAIVAWALSALLLRALSRYRELSADRAAALITGRPSALASALIKLDEEGRKVPKKDLRSITSVAALCVVPPKVSRGIARIAATHPTTERRVAALHALEAQLQQSGPRLR